MATLPRGRLEDSNEAYLQLASEEGVPNRVIVIGECTAMIRYLAYAKQLIDGHSDSPYEDYLLSFDRQGLKDIFLACRKVLKVEIEAPQLVTFLSCPKYCLILLLYQQARAPPQRSFLVLSTASFLVLPLSLQISLSPIFIFPLPVRGK